MRQWTLEERYRVLHDPEEVRELHERNAQSAYRQTYHVQPVCGLSSDPNGFVKHDGVWHLFYQWCPWGAVHGLKYWYHVTSEDLVNWHNAGIGLKPDRDYDNKGTHSGSAISQGKELYFFYTGNHRDENWVRTPYTCAAYLGSDGRPVKLEQPLFGPRDDYSEHQRDPKVFYVAERGCYYIFIGAQTADGKGCVLVYTSEKLLEGWSFAGQLHVPGYESFGGMWECPSIEHIDGKDVLVFSPQYTKLPGRAESTNHNVYFIGKMDYDTLTFTPEGDYHYLDYGFDFYAAQIAPHTEESGAATMIAWIGLPDNHYPTEPEDWEGSMALPRELRVRDGRLIQTPVAAMADLRMECVLSVGGSSFLDGTLSGALPKACEMVVRISGERDFDMALFTKQDGSGGLTLSWKADSKTITVDKRGLDLRFNEKVGEVLSFTPEHALRELHFFIDHSSTEIFINGGEETFTAHTYPTARESFFRMNKPEEVSMWTLAPSVKDDFVV
ncbi:MAG: sucrose-6-phosphate hydrolase [Lachnospiraceae bacterium]|nr:sucrose-6-phosphate hydrolase [Lachnospiraceae bacterium]